MSPGELTLLIEEAAPLFAARPQEADTQFTALPAGLPARRRRGSRR